MEIFVEQNNDLILCYLKLEAGRQDTTDQESDWNANPGNSFQ